MSNITADVDNLKWVRDVLKENLREYLKNPNGSLVHALWCINFLCWHSVLEGDRKNFQNNLLQTRAPRHGWIWELRDLISHQLFVERKDRNRSCSPGWPWRFHISESNLQFPILSPPHPKCWNIPHILQVLGIPPYLPTIGSLFSLGSAFLLMNSLC